MVKEHDQRTNGPSAIGPEGMVTTSSPIRSDPQADPSLQTRMKFQAFVMAGVALLFLVSTLCIGLIIPIVQRILQ